MTKWHGITIISEDIGLMVKLAEESTQTFHMIHTEVILDHMDTQHTTLGHIIILTNLSMTMSKPHQLMIVPIDAPLLKALADHHLQNTKKQHHH